MRVFVFLFHPFTIIACSSSGPPLVVVPIPVFFRRSLLPLVVVPVFFQSLGDLLLPGRAIGKVLGRRDDNDDDAPQRRWPTTSARRQRQQQVVVEDPPTPEEKLVDNQPEAPVQEGVIDVEGFPGGSHDTSVLKDYENHIALRVWNGEERPELKLSSHGRKMTKFGRPAPEIEGLVAASGLSPLITCSLDTGNRGLMSAFMERWHKETSSFYLPIGEVTITLDDVASLLHFPVAGVFHSFKLLKVDDAVEMLVELLKVSATEARAEMIQCHGSYVRLSWLRDVYKLKIEACDWIVAARVYLLHLFGCTIFANKSATHVHVVFLDALHDLTQSRGYAWGPAALCWIYKHFPSIASIVPTEDYDERRSCACRWTSGKALPVSTYRRCLERLTLDAGPLTVIHRSETVIRQFSYIQAIPPHLAASLLSVAEIDDRWKQFSEYIALVGQLCAVPGHCLPDYMDWFYMISHPFMSLA
ncbi:uncharacterized protein LOC114385955 [Glycine soja]|uniref:uncharacterized protein LOC114385955 n=1 Tax=Glycine soja TaxID=3848 RepID=UPI00103D7A8C|nr:uncharacterized protein LOC114385955 [Glycine soja]